jgi:prepilin-type N-terminal cleavage/methylation domain-containing protein
LERPQEEKTMQQQKQQIGRQLARAHAGMTLIEVVVAILISGLAVAGIVSGYVFSVRSAEKSALSLAANARAMERLEATRGAQWNTSSWPAVDQLVSTNFPAQVVLLDLSGSGMGSTYGTNVIQISQISTNPPLRRIRVDCTWRYNGTQLLTNSIETCRAPDS